LEENYFHTAHFDENISLLNIWRREGDMLKRFPRGTGPVETWGALFFAYTVKIPGTLFPWVFVSLKE
jgi:hypothetical protein